MSDYAEFDVIEKKAGAMPQTIRFVFASFMSDAWKHTNGQNVWDAATFDLREIRLLKNGNVWLKLTCPGGGYHWHLGSANNPNWRRRVRMPLPWVSEQVPRWRRIDGELFFVPTSLGVGAAIRGEFSLGGGNPFVQWNAAGGVTVDNTANPVRVQAPLGESGKFFLQLSPGGSAEERRVGLKWTRDGLSSERWPLHKADLTDEISIELGGFDDMNGRQAWTVTQTMSGHVPAFLSLWDGVVKDYHESIHKIRDGARDSAMPLRAGSDETVVDAKSRGLLKYELQLPADFLHPKPDKWDGGPCLRLERWRAETDTIEVQKLLLLLRGITLASPSAVFSPPDTLLVSNDVKLALIIEKATLYSQTAGEDTMRTADIASLHLSGTIQTRAAADAPGAKKLPMSTDIGAIRDGAFGFTLAPESVNHPGSLKVRVQDPVTGQLWWMDTSKIDAAKQPVAFMAGALVSPIVEGLSIPIAAVMPGGQDPLPGDDFIAPHWAASLPASQLSSLAPVIIPLRRDSTHKGSPARYLLRCVERSGWQRSAVLDLELHQLGSFTLEKGDVLVVDTAPFSVMRVEHEPLSVLNPEEITVLARRSSGAAHGASWELQDVDGDLTIMLPPQGLGEAMEKAKLKPDGSPLEDIQEGELADFRLSPGARLTLAASYFAKRYVEPPWNTRRQFGWAGQRDPGAGIKKLEFELLYGLSCEVTKPWLRLADLLSRVGALPRLPAAELAWKGTLGQVGAFSTWALEQQALALAIRSRLGVLEVWDQRQPEGLKLKDGLEYFPRVEKKPDNAPTENSPRGAQLRFPLLRYDKDDPDLGGLKKNLHNEEGLAGGFTWAFESGNIYKELWRSPRSSSAALEGLWFSALGGWGHQTARFAGDKTVIESRISMGRTHFYVLERIGRIGVFWNKAKHVILYERVTGRTRQFGDADDDDGVYQDAHAGRPILRKVREYVEILEPERFYPDFPGDEALHCGFVTGCVFRSKIMPVKSTWGCDVKAFGAPISGSPKVTREGWEIPLWQEGSDATTYPKPQIELEVITDPDSGEAGKMRVGLEQPQRLFFFTETTEGTTAEVHAWNPFPWTDYCDLPEPTVLDTEEPALSPGTPDATLPDAEEELPGYERFTFKVVAGAPQASVTARRVTEAGMSATLRNVSMMRAVPNGKKNSPTAVLLEKAWYAQKALTEARAQLLKVKDDKVANVRRLLDGSGTTTANVKAALETWLAGAFGNDIVKVKALGDHLLPSTEGLGCGFPLPAMNAVGTWLWKHADHEAFRFHQFVKDQVIAPPFNTLISFLTEAEKLNSSSRDKVIFEIEAARAAVRKTWRGFQGVLDSGLQAPRDAARRFFDRCRQEFERLSSFPDAWIAEIESIARSAAANVPVARMRIEHVLGDQEKAFAAFIQDLRQLLVWAEKEARKLAVSTIAQPVDWLDAILAGLEELGLRLNELEMTGEDLFTAVYEAVKELAAEPQWVVSELASLRDALRRERLVYVNRVAQMTTDWDKMFNQWVTTTIELSVDATERGISAFVNVIDNALLDLRERVKALADPWPAGIKKEREDLETKSKDMLDALKKDLCDFLRTVVVPRIEKFDTMLSLGAWKEEIAAVKDWFASNTKLAGEIMNRVTSFSRLEKAIDAGDWAAARREVDQVLKDASTEFRNAAGEVLAHSRKIYETLDVANGVRQEASRTLRSVRVLCDALTAPGLGFNRKTVALFYQARGTVIGMTPCVAKMRELGDSLQSLGLRLPTAEISERLKGLREKLPQFNFGTILADLGLDFSSMFPGFKMPADFDDYLKLTHDVDEKQMRAWARADLDYQIPGRRTLFSIGPIEVSLNRARVEGRASIEAELERPATKSTWARMKGDWELNIGGSPLVTFVDAEVVMDNGRMDFNLKPEKIVMSGALKMLTDLTAGLGTIFADSGFTLGFLKEGEIPVGLRAVLELPCFDAAGATSGVTGLQLGASFELRALDEDLRLNFSIGAGFHLGRKDKPFNVLIFILGGGGWVETDIYYRPKGGEIVVRVSIGLQVSASLALNLGVVRGAVGVYLGIFADYTKRTGQSGAMQVGIMLLFRGEVDVLGIITVMLSLLMEVVYLSDGQKKSFYGRGTLCLEIRICWCFKIKVRKSVTYNFGGGGSASLAKARPHLLGATSLTDYEAAAKHYVNYFL